MLEHGGNLRQAAATFGRPPGDWIDLSTGINPLGYPIPELSAKAWHRLPEAEPALLPAACHYYGMPALLAVAGTQAAIQALPRLRPPSQVVVAAPSYAEHAHHWAMHGHQMRQVAYAELDAALGDADVVVVCNPNNPTGQMLAPERLLAWAAQLAGRGGWLVVDEAFADTAPQASVGQWSERPGLIVLRSVGKFFGLAGLRLGFVGAEAALLERLAAMLGPWAVSGPAQQIALAALEDKAWQSASRTRLIADGRRLHQLLAAHGIAASGCALFQWWPEARAEAFRHHMAVRGIWVRFFPHAAHGIRLGLPASEHDWQQLTLALTEWNKSL